MPAKENRKEDPGFTNEREKERQDQPAPPTPEEGAPARSEAEPAEPSPPGTEGPAREDPEALAARLQEMMLQQEDRYLRLLAEYDNFRKRSQKEKDALWGEVKCNTAAAFLPVYDNLERALKQECSDAAYAKGIEMTMAQLRSVLESLGIEEIPALGEAFDPAYHNAMMHVQDELQPENTVVEVFQAGFKLGEKVIRFSMVKVAN